MVPTRSDCRTVSRFPSSLGPCPSSVQRRAGILSLLGSPQAWLPTGLITCDTDQTTAVAVKAAIFREGAMCQAPSACLASGSNIQRPRLKHREVKPLTEVAWPVGGRTRAQNLVSRPWSPCSLLLCCSVSCPHAFT